MRRCLEDRLAHRNRVGALVRRRILNETTDSRAVPRRHRAAANYGDQDILGVRRGRGALVMLMPVTALFPAMAMIEQVHAAMGDRCRHRKTVVAVAVFHGASPDRI